MIDISIWREPDTLSIAITDNGAGIDIEHAKEIMSHGLCLEEYLAEKGL